MATFVPWLIGGALAAPLILALLARLAGRWSSVARMGLGGLGGLVGAGCVLALLWTPPDQLQLGKFAIFVPARAPLVDEQSFALVPAAPDAPPQVAVVPAPSAAPAATVLATPSTAPSIIVLPSAAPTLTLQPSATPSSAPTATPTATPSPRATATPTPQPSATPEPTPSAAPTATPKPAPTERPARQTYTVQPGDTLRKIAAKFGIEVQALLDANGLTRKQGDNLKPDQKLRIPAR